MTSPHHVKLYFSYSFNYLVLLGISLFVTALFGWSQTALSQPTSTMELRLTELENREQIRRVMKQYGRFLDLNDFDAFANLFTQKDSQYISGGVTTTGSKAIGQSLQEIFSANPSGLKDPRFHVFFNETIDFNTPTEATAFSQSAYIVPSENNTPEMVFFASYEDVFVIEDKRWKFKQRIVHGDIP